VGSLESDVCPLSSRRVSLDGQRMIVEYSVDGAIADLYASSSQVG